ncbi:MAG: acyltransferase [Motilibacteraceae bacterium]
MTAAPSTSAEAGGTPRGASLRPGGRRPDIALLRVVAICGVVVIHVSGLTLAQAAVSHEPVWWVALVLKTGTRWCVPLFVVVSGALLLRPGVLDDPRRFYRRRLSRLLPALVVWHLVYIVFLLTVRGQEFHPTLVLAGLLTGRTYTALYFFWLILGLYLVSPLLWRAVRDLDDRGRLRLGAVLVAVACAWQSVVFFLATYAHVDVAAAPTIFTYWVPYTGYFLLGAGLGALQVPRRAALPAAAGFVLLTAVVVWQGSGASPDAFDVVFPQAYHGWLVAACTVLLFLTATALLAPADASSDAAGPGRRGAALLRLLDTLAALTLGVFALHLLVLYALQHSGVLTVENGASRLLELAYLVGGTIGLSFLAAWVLSRLPGARRLV